MNSLNGKILNKNNKHRRNGTAPERNASWQWTTKRLQRTTASTWLCNASETLAVCQRRRQRRPPDNRTDHRTVRHQAVVLDSTLTMSVQLHCFLQDVPLTLQTTAVVIWRMIMQRILDSKLVTTLHTKEMLFRDCFCPNWLHTTVK